jgi:peptidoglycan/xylan/chitin deacetylase (PgdA/CDA1 family)
LRSHGAPYTIYVASGLVEGLADIWWEGLEAIVRQQDQLFVQDVSGGIAMDCRTLDEKHQVYGELLDYFSTKMDEREQRRRVRELAWLYKVDLEAARREQIMNWDELQKLSRDPLCTLGAHTIHHYALARLSKQDARHEMLQSARVLEAETGKHARHFAYPYGYPAAAGKREFELARDLGFATAVTTRPGVLHRDHASHETALPRISLNGHFQQTRYTKALMSGAPTFAMNRFRHLNVA